MMFDRASDEDERQLDLRLRARKSRIRDWSDDDDEEEDTEIHESFSRSAPRDRRLIDRPIIENQYK